MNNMVKNMNAHNAQIHERVSTLKLRMSSKRVAAGVMFSNIRNCQANNPGNKNILEKLQNALNNHSISGDNAN